ncbi:hypothetical protein E2C01_016051 [Portunus trituberculatus]|uniref:Uncharacterized protein n=1 Tax=Portunus trituberculatus TaxID=210409 RepID=A0A5B7DQ12_PORTR|nr:hypothetical protein [Portunus trituberculatus]
MPHSAITSKRRSASRASCQDLERRSRSEMERPFLKLNCLVMARFPHSLVRTGTRSWEVTPCFSFTKLHHHFESSWLEDNILLLLSSHLALAHFATCVKSVHAARCIALFRWVSHLLYRCHTLYLCSAAMRHQNPNQGWSFGLVV